METAISLNEIGLYNPQRQSAEVTKALFAVRQKQFNSLLKSITAEKKDSRPQHYLVIGQRGMGKTTLLKRIEVELHEEKYRKQFIPLLFPEEQYNLKNLATFWLNCLDALASSLEAEKNNTEIVKKIDTTIKELSKKKPETISEESYKFLTDTCRNLQRRPILLIDNIDLVFNRLEKHGQHDLRSVLNEKGAPIVIGGGVVETSNVTEYVNLERIST
jgi:Cdc6-like AAA superfamily ATPase